MANQGKPTAKKIEGPLFVSKTNLRGPTPWNYYEEIVQYFA